MTTAALDQTQAAVASNPIPGFYAVVPAGGSGTRLWPLSRSNRPKFLFDLLGNGKSFLQETAARLAPLATDLVLVTGAKHVAACREQLPDLPEANVFAEPSPRDSMAAIGLAAAVLNHRHGDVVIGSFAADHVITGQATFEQVVREAVAVARHGYVVTIGIAAPHPATGFGYIHRGEALNIPDAPTAFSVVGFTEKPDAKTAREYVASGEYYWNAGMFIVRTSVLLDHLAKLRPELHEGLVEIAAAWDTPDRAAVLERVWPGLEKISIDHALAEPVAAAGGVAVVPGTFAWEDIGDFNTLGLMLPTRDDDGNRVVGPGDVVTTEAGGNLVIPMSGRVVALLGVDDLVVVDTPDAVLVATRSRAQQVKEVVDAVRAIGDPTLI